MTTTHAPSIDSDPREEIRATYRQVRAFLASRRAIAAAMPRRKRRLPELAAAMSGGMVPMLGANVVRANPADGDGGGGGGGGGMSGGGGSGDVEEAVFSDLFANGFIEERWTQWLGIWTEAAGVLSTDEASGTPAAIIATGNDWTDQEASAVLNTAGATAGVGVRLGFSGGLLSGYVVRGSGVSGYLWLRYDAGVASTLRSGFTGGPGIGNELLIEIIGTTIQAKKNGGNMGASVIDATYASGRAGLLRFTGSGAVTGFREFTARPR